MLVSNLKAIRHNNVGEHAGTLKEWYSLSCKDVKFSNHTETTQNYNNRYGYGRTFAWVSKNGTQYRFLPNTAFNRKLRKHPKDFSRINFVLDEHGVTIDVWLG
jgi:hypothetical protein